MALKSVAAAIGMTLLMSSGVTLAAGYKPDEFLSLDLSKAVFSPNPLGPPAQFENVPVEAKATPEAQALPSRAVAGHGSAHHWVVHAKPAIAHPKLAKRQGNPLDSQARDTRIQVWPCRSGGICGWQK
jgi:hypothetical protein